MNVIEPYCCPWKLGQTEMIDMKYYFGIMNFILKKVCIVLSVLFVGCSSNPRSEEKQYLIEDLPLDSVAMELWFPELMAVSARKYVSMDGKLCLVSPNEDALVYLIDETDAKEIGYLGGTLEGPEDMSPFPQYMGMDTEKRNLYLFDFNKRRMNMYHLSTDEEKPRLKLIGKKDLHNPFVENIRSSFLSICRLDNGYYVGLSYLSHKNLFVLLDENLQIIKEFGEYPLDGLTTDGSIINMAGMTFEGTLLSVKNSIYYASKKFGYMARYDISEIGEPQYIWDYYYNKASYKIENNQIKFRGQSNQHGFANMVVGEKYIFATYSGVLTGKMFEERNVYAIDPETLVVLTYDGRPVGRFKLNCHSTLLGLSGDGKYLYVHNSDPEVQIMRIRISDILDKI